MLEWFQSCSVTRDEFFQYGLTLGKGLLVFFLYYLLALFLSTVLSKILFRLKGDASAVTELLRRVSFLFFLSLGVVSAFSEWGFDVRGLLATLGLTGFALGLALKDAVANIISGVLLIFYAPFRLGSQVKIAGKEGKVTKIDIKHTIIQDSDGSLHILPNSKVLGEVITVMKP